MELIRRLWRWTPGTLATAFVVSCFMSALIVVIAMLLATSLVEPVSTWAQFIGLAAGFTLVPPFALIPFAYIAFFIALFGVAPVLLLRRFVVRRWFGILAVFYGSGVSVWWHGAARHGPGENLALAAMGAVSAICWWALARRVILRDLALEDGTHYLGDNGELLPCTD